MAVTYWKSIRSRQRMSETHANHQSRTGDHRRYRQHPAHELEDAVSRVFAPEDDALRAVRERANEHRLPAISISALQGKLLYILAKAAGAQKILEIGALAGYSGVWLARALPPAGRLITLEIDPAHAAVVRETFRSAGVDDHTEVRVGPALQSLPQLSEEAPFDLIFIDADKGNYPAYLSWARRLARVGTVIVADNCLTSGSDSLLPANGSQEPWLEGPRTYNQLASSDPQLSSVALPIRSGMTVSVVLEPAANDPPAGKPRG
jgi:caffeoyl-CoA O-methyltransferase